jgi:dihydroflavonol-4-reductase
MDRLQSPERGAVLVTGAAGHLGANLVRALLAQGRQVRVLVHRQTRAIDGLPVHIARGDLLDRESLVGACAGMTTVFHLGAAVSAGWQKASQLDPVNVGGTANLIQACFATGVQRLLHFSSIQALATTSGADLDETCGLLDAHAGGPGAYDRTKAAGERLVLAAAERGLDATILNPTAVLGPFDFQPSPMGEVLRALGRGKLPALVAGATCDFVDARDVATAALDAERKGRSGERYLLSGTRLSLVDLARRWSLATGRAAPQMVFPMATVRMVTPFAVAYARLRGRRPLLTSASLRILRTQPPVRRTKAEGELGFRPRPFEETLRDTCQWMRDQSWL